MKIGFKFRIIGISNMVILIGQKQSNQININPHRKINISHRQENKSQPLIKQKQIRLIGKQVQYDCYGLSASVYERHYFILSHYSLLVLVFYDQAHPSCQPFLCVKVVMPSIHKLRFIDVDDVVIVLRVFKIVSFTVHADSHNVMSSLIVIRVRPRVVNGFEVLKQHDDWNKLHQVGFQILDGHVLSALKGKNVLQIPLSVVDQLMEAVFEHIWPCSSERNGSSGFHYVRFPHIYIVKMENSFQGSWPATVNSRLENIWYVYELNYSLICDYLIRFLAFDDVRILEFRQGLRDLVLAEREGHCAQDQSCFQDHLNQIAL